jgi:hypothetical protein
MDPTRFDRLAVVVGRQTSRRAALGFLAATGLLTIGVPDAEAARCSKQKPCLECKRCRRHKCRPTQSGLACSDDGNECTRNECDGDGACAHPPKSAGTACSDDGNECTRDECDGNGACAHPDEAAGTVCGGNIAGKTCDGGTCECSAPVGNNKAVGDVCDQRRPSECTSGKCGCNDPICPCTCRNANCVGSGESCAVGGSFACCEGVCSSNTCT